MGGDKNLCYTQFGNVFFFKIPPCHRKSTLISLTSMRWRVTHGLNIPSRSFVRWEKSWTPWLLVIFPGRQQSRSGRSWRLMGSRTGSFWRLHGLTIPAGRWTWVQSIANFTVLFVFDPTGCYIKTETRTFVSVWLWTVSWESSLTWIFL